MRRPVALGLRGPIARHGGVVKRWLVSAMVAAVVGTPPILRAQSRALQPQNQRFVESGPKSEQALIELGSTLLRARRFEESLEAFRSALSLDPQNVEANFGAGRAMAAEGKYTEALARYDAALSVSPEHYDALQAKAYVLFWTHRFAEAEAIFEVLALRRPDDPQNAKAVATIARQARLFLAQTDLKQGRFQASLRRFNRLLDEYPSDADALFGKAQASYYRGKLRAAEEAATTLVELRPRNLDGIVLLARVERARGHRRAALGLLDYAAQISPNDREVQALKKQVAGESRVTVHTSFSFAREIGAPTELVDVRGILHQGLPNSDLRAFSYSTTVGLSLLPRTDSYFSFTALPSASPAGPLRDPKGNQIPTGTTGAVAPLQFLYRQTRQLWRRFTVRAGAGLVRFGPGGLVQLPGEPTPAQSVTTSPLALAGFTITPTKKFSFDLDLARSPILYTPVSVKFGVIEERIGSRLNFFFDPRTELHVEYHYGHFSSRPLRRAEISPLGVPPVKGNAAKYDQGHSGSIVFNRNLFRCGRVSLDAGYSGLAYGFAGRRRGTLLGFFNPAFYQSHLATARVYGKLWRPLSYDLSGGVGVERIQLDVGRLPRAFDPAGNPVALARAPIDRALLVSPSLTYKVNPRFSLTLGYTHYTTAQSLGVLRGNAVRVETDWKF